MTWTMICAQRSNAYPFPTRFRINDSYFITIRFSSRYSLHDGWTDPSAIIADTLFWIMVRVDLSWFTQAISPISPVLVSYHWRVRFNHSESKVVHEFYKSVPCCTAPLHFIIARSFCSNRACVGKQSVRFEYTCSTSFCV